MDNVVTSGDVIEIKTTSDVFFEEAPYDYFTFDSRTRKITIPASFVTLGVESDDSSERVWFEGPRIVGDNIDLTTRNIYINYQNANGEKDRYYVEDIVAEDDIVHFSWKVERKVVAYKGNVTFLICALTTDEEGKVETEWHTARCFAPVLEGLEVENPAPPAEEYDLINQLIDVTKKSIKDVTDTCAQTIEELGTKEQEAINNIAEKETNSIDAVEKAKNDAVDYIGSGLDGTLTKQGIAAESQAVGDAILKARIVDKSSGELISLSDSAEQPLQSMKIFGKTKQFTTTGKNKLPYPYVSTTKTLNGITWTDNGDGSLTVNGTTTDTLSGFDLWINPIFEDGKTYKISYGTSVGGLGIICSYKDAEGVVKYASSSITWSSEYTNAKVYLQVYDNKTMNNITIYPIIVEGSSYDGIWEPYTGGIPSPNPDYPQELVSVGDSGSTTEYVMGKNLCNLETPFNFDGSTINHKVNCHIPEPFCLTIHSTITGVSQNAATFIQLLYDDGSIWNLNCREALKYSTVGEHIDSCTSNGGRTLIQMKIVNWCSAVGTINKMQIELGTTSTPYEPHKEQSLTIPTPNGLPGVPVSSGGNYTDSNGQQYVCDYKDYERNVYVQKSVEYRNTGEPMSMASAVVSSKNTKVIYWNHCLYNIKPHKIQDNKTIISNYFVSSYKYESTEGCCVMISHSAANNGTYLYFSASVDTLEYGTTYTDVKTAISAWLAKTFSEDNPLIVRCQLAEPIETPLTKEEIQAYKALHTNYPNTTIYNSDGAGAEVEYVADTKLYVDNKIDKAIKNILEVVSNDG